MTKMKLKGTLSIGEALTKEEMKTIPGGFGSGSGSGSESEEQPIYGCSCTYSILFKGTFTDVLPGNSFTSESCQTACETHCSSINGAMWPTGLIIP